MKKAITILTICLLTFAGTQTMYAQEKNTTKNIDWNPPKLPDDLGNSHIYNLTKEETVKYINDVYKKTYSWLDKNGNRKNVEVVSITLDGTSLIQKYTDGRLIKTNLNTARNLKTKEIPNHNNEYYIYTTYIDGNEDFILYWISSEYDAIDLKDALEHLVTIIDSDISSIKKEAVKKVETLYKNAYKSPTGENGEKITVKSVTLDENNNLIRTLSDGRISKTPIMDCGLDIKENTKRGGYYFDGGSNTRSFFFEIATKEDALQIKNALKQLKNILSFR